MDPFSSGDSKKTTSVKVFDPFASESFSSSQTPQQLKQTSQQTSSQKQPQVSNSSFSSFDQFNTPHSNQSDPFAFPSSSNNKTQSSDPFSGFSQPTQTFEMFANNSSSSSSTAATATASASSSFSTLPVQHQQQHQQQFSQQKSASSDLISIFDNPSASNSSSVDPFSNFPQSNTFNSSTNFTTISSSSSSLSQPLEQPKPVVIGTTTSNKQLDDPFALLEDEFSSSNTQQPASTSSQSFPQNYGSLVEQNPFDIQSQPQNQSQESYHHYPNSDWNGVGSQNNYSQNNYLPNSTTIYDNNYNHNTSTNNNNSIPLNPFETDIYPTFNTTNSVKDPFFTNGSQTINQGFDTSSTSSVSQFNWN